MKILHSLSRLVRRRARASSNVSARRKRLLCAELLERRQLFAADIAAAESDVVQIRLEITDMSGDEVSAVEVGDRFQLRALVRDLRPFPEGVFAAYFDVDYTPLASVAGSIVYGSEYPNLQLGDTAVAGTIDEAGAFAGMSPLGAGEFLVMTVPFTATEAGTFVFTAGPADNGSLDEVLLFGTDDNVPVSRIRFGSTSLSVAALAPPSGAAAPLDVHLSGPYFWHPDEIAPEATDSTVGEIKALLSITVDPVIGNMSDVKSGGDESFTMLDPPGVLAQDSADTGDLGLILHLGVSRLVEAGRLNEHSVDRAWTAE